MTLWEIFNNGAVPWASETNQEAAELIISGSTLEQMKCPDMIFQIISTCFLKDPNSRPSFEELYKQLHKLKKVAAKSTASLQNLSKKSDDGDEKEDNYLRSPVGS